MHGKIVKIMELIFYGLTSEGFKCMLLLGVCNPANFTVTILIVLVFRNYMDDFKPDNR